MYVCWQKTQKDGKMIEMLHKQNMIIWYIFLKILKDYYYDTINE